MAKPLTRAQQCWIADLIQEGKSDPEIAKAMGVSRSTAFRYRNGERGVDIPQAKPMKPKVINEMMRGWR